MGYIDTQLFIDGKWQPPVEGKTLPVVNPATGKEIGRVAHAGRTDLDRALQAAQKGFEVWRDMVPAARSVIMRKAAALIRERANDIAPLLTQEQGKPLAEAKGETLAAADIIEWFAEEGFRVYGRIVPSRLNNSIRQMVMKDPVGPVAAFTPWNFPINQVVRKVGAGLAAGCSMLVKAPEETPAAPAALIKAFADAGLPPGVLGLVYGNPAEISSYLIPHPVIRKITFTGSIPVGKQLAALAGPAHEARHHGARRPRAGDRVRGRGHRGRGQGGGGGEVPQRRPGLHLAHALPGAQVDRRRFRAGAHRPRQGTQGRRRHDRRHADGPARQPAPHGGDDRVHRGRGEEGREAPHRRQRIGKEGNFWQPTILSDVPREAKIFNDEPFGPVAAIQPFDTLEAAIAESNRLPIGLAGYAFTKSLKNSDLLARKLEVGMLWMNMPAIPSAEMPFGGVKDSGYGSEGGPEAMEAYLNSRAVVIQNA